MIVQVVFILILLPDSVQGRLFACVWVLSFGSSFYELRLVEARISNGIKEWVEIWGIMFNHE
jgi:hypothetical protein